MLWPLGLDFCKVMWRFGQIQTAAILLFGSFSESKTRFVIPRYCLGLLADLCLHWSLVVSSQTATMVLWADGSLVGDLCYHWRGVPRTGSAEAPCSSNGGVGHGKSHPFYSPNFCSKPALFQFYCRTKGNLVDLSLINAPRKGERVLIHAATGGVGLVAVQFAQRVGATIFATAGSPGKVQHLRDMGVKYITSSRDAKVTWWRNWEQEGISWMPLKKIW